MILYPSPCNSLFPERQTVLMTPDFGLSHGLGHGEGNRRDSSRGFNCACKARPAFLWFCDCHENTSRKRPAKVKDMEGCAADWHLSGASICAQSTRAKPRRVRESKYYCLKLLGVRWLIIQFYHQATINCIIKKKSSFLFIINIKPNFLIDSSLVISYHNAEVAKDSYFLRNGLEISLPIEAHIVTKLNTQMN